MGGYPNPQPLDFSWGLCDIYNMENNTTPNSPAELLAMQAANREADTDDCNAFADFICDEILPDLEPSPYQTVKAVEKLLARLKVYHFDMLHDEEIEMEPWVKNMWQEDYQRLSAALDAIRLINPD